LARRSPASFRRDPGLFDLITGGAMMQLIRCDIFDSKDSETPTWKGILAYIESNGNSDSMQEWIGHFPIADSAVALEEAKLMGMKYMRVHDGRSGEIILTSSVVEPSGTILVEFEGVGLFDWADHEWPVP
jgi:hypothetical protein